MNPICQMSDFVETLEVLFKISGAIYGNVPQIDLGSFLTFDNVLDRPKSKLILFFFKSTSNLICAIIYHYILWFEICMHNRMLN